MNAENFTRWGIPSGPPQQATVRTIKRLFAEGVPYETVRSQLLNVIANPEAHREDSHWAELAAKLLEKPNFEPRSAPAPWQQWGQDLEETAVQQMRNACDLPVAVRGALMPDAHLGYGLPIGGVLATENAVIPYAVGVDIACRMKLTVLDVSPKKLEKSNGIADLTRTLNEVTRFGMGASFRKQRTHAVLDADWSVSPVTKKFKDKAWAQLGTSGSGNHFVEFGLFTVTDAQLGLEPGTYVALLSHSGSRGTGAAVAAHYSKLAREAHPELPKELSHLAWLDLDSEAGAEYWAAMNLMGDYAAANHACIHDEMQSRLACERLLDIENHHNFAWKELHDGKEVIVHRKGATPAGAGVLGIIPGSMASPAFVVRGKGNPASLHSASHGAGRVMSRTKALHKFKWKDVKQYLLDRDVTLISAGLDEVPMVYKDIHEVMEAQSDLVEPLGRFDPRLVKMAPAGEKPED
jgi:tRNA-splicing ligase RtcB